MNAKIEIQAKVKDGELIIDRALLKQRIKETFKRDAPVDFILRYNVDSKTKRQNAYFHVIVSFFQKHLIESGFDSITAEIGGREIKIPLNFENVKTLLKQEINVQRIDGAELKNVNVGDANIQEMSVMIDSAIIYLKNTHNIEVPKQQK